MKHPAFDIWLEKARIGKPELQTLRKLLLEEGLTETIKWGMPVYTWNQRNLIGLGAFKEHIALWFYHGVFLQDNSKVLHNVQEGKTEGMRQWHFRKPFHLDESLIKAYIQEAVENLEAGKEWKPQRNKALILPPELVEVLNLDSELKKAFEALTPGNQRAYADHISEAKRVETRKTRIEKCKAQILAGVGLNDMYRNK